MGELPLPLAALALRARNAKSAKERHDLAYFGWEAAIRLAVAVRPLDPAKLAMPSTGDWVAALEREATSLDAPPLLHAHALFAEHGLGRTATPAKTSVPRLLEGLPAYRNHVIGHGAVRNAEFYETAGEVLASGLPAFVEAVWPPDAALVFVESIELTPDGERRARVLDLTGTAGRVADPRGSLVPASVMSRRLYQRRGDTFRSLHPWLMFDAAGLRERVLFFNGRGRGARYLDYVGGEQLKGKALTSVCATIEADLDGVLVAAVEAVDEHEETHDPSRFGDYQLLGKLGEGGMGVVYLARQRSMDRLVALKMLPAGAGDDPIAVARFEREIAALARCEHPNVVKILASGEAEGKRYYAMELIEGADLSQVARSLESGSDVDAAISTASDRIRRAKQEAFDSLPKLEQTAQLPRGRDRVRALVEMFRDAACALDHLHANGIVHRDVKPANLMVTAGDHRVVIMDLGLAAIADASRSLTRDDRSILGTLRYLPPEQLQRSLLQVDRRADIYSLGATFYELLTGRAFLDGDSEPRLIEQVLHGRPVDARTANPSLPQDLAVILTKATEKDPKLRYDTADALARDLDAFLQGRPITARPPSLGYVLRLTIRRHRAIAATIAIAIVLALGGATWFLARERALRRTAEHERTLAQVARSQSEALLSYMLNELRNQLADVGRLDLLDSVTQEAVAYYTERGEPTAKFASALLIRGAVLEARGKLADAVALVRRAIDIQRALPDGGVDLDGSLRKLSDLLHTQGDLAGALAAAQEAQAIAQKQLLKNPSSGDRQRDLAATYKKVGDVLRARKDVAGALAAYRSALAIRGQIVHDNPTNLVWQRDLAINHERVAELLDESGDTDGALSELRTGLAIIETLDTKSESTARDLAIFNTRIGDLLFERGDHDGALASYKAALAIDTRMADEHRRSVMWQRDTSIAHQNIGHVLAAKDDHDGALVEYRADLAIATRLAALDPTNVEWQRDLSISHETIADLLLTTGDVAGGIAELRKSEPILRSLVESDTTNSRWKSDLADTYEKLARGYTRAGDAAQAATAQAEATRLRSGT